jgi:TIR domain
VILHRDDSVTVNFFISYTRVDSAWAEWIAFALEEQGYTVTVQAWDFRPGSDFAVEMQKAASQMERIIAVLSPDYLKFGFAESGWSAAFARDPKATRADSYRLSCGAVNFPDY